ncbi:MAG: polysaccharide lyase [Cyanobacteria bacterium J06621_12]
MSKSKSLGCFIAFRNTTCKSANSSSRDLAVSIANRQNSQQQSEQRITFDLTRFDVTNAEGFSFNSINAANFFMATVTDQDPYQIIEDPYRMGTNFNGFDQRARIVKHPSIEKRSALKIEFPKGEYGTLETGVNAKIPLKIESDRVYLEYSFSFLGLEGDSDSLPQMGKLLGLCIAECTTGKKPSDGTNGASTRISYRSYRDDKMALFGYIYHLGQKNDYGTYIPAPYRKAKEALENLSVIGEADSNYPTIKLGEDQINDVRMIVSLNTPGKANGEVEIYLNNRLLSHAKKLMFRESADEKFSGLAFDIFHGGGADARIPVNASILLYEITVAPH